MAKRLGTGVVMTLGVVLTLVLGVAAVWLTGDARAAGVVVIVAGIVATTPLVLEELRVTHAPAAATDARRGRTPTVDKAA